MADSAPIRRSGLERVAIAGRHGAQDGAPGLVVSERADLALATVIARNGAEQALAQRVLEVFALELPTTPRCVERGSLAFVWAGPSRWLAVAQGEDGSRFEARLRRVLSGLASVADQSDGRVVLRLAGPGVRETLARGVPIDLHQRSFRPGDAAHTVVAHTSVQLWQLDSAPTFEIAVPRTYAAAFWRWLAEAGAEFGLLVVDDDSAVLLPQQI